MDPRMLANKKRPPAVVVDLDRTSTVLSTLRLLWI